MGQTMGAGLPLGPTFANLFMCHFEKLWLASCPADFAPIFYRRYVDDCFLLFKNPTHPDLFLSYLINKHPNIKFTVEKESNAKLPFLDVLVQKGNGRFVTSVYRKPSFSGLGTTPFFIRFKTPNMLFKTSNIHFKTCNIRFKTHNIHFNLSKIRINLSKLQF